ncbi:hypothetical protein PCE1_002698 [Barthelona sp. PCE]
MQHNISISSQNNEIFICSEDNELNAKSRVFLTKADEVIHGPSPEDNSYSILNPMLSNPTIFYRIKHINDEHSEIELFNFNRVRRNFIHFRTDIFRGGHISGHLINDDYILCNNGIFNWTNLNNIFEVNISDSLYIVHETYIYIVNKHNYEILVVLSVDSNPLKIVYESESTQNISKRFNLDDYTGDKLSIEQEDGGEHYDWFPSFIIPQCIVSNTDEWNYVVIDKNVYFAQCFEGKTKFSRMKLEELRYKFSLKRNSVQNLFCDRIYEFHELSYVLNWSKPFIEAFIPLPENFVLSSVFRFFDNETREWHISCVVKDNNRFYLFVDQKLKLDFDNCDYHKDYKIVFNNKYYAYSFEDTTEDSPYILVVGSFNGDNRKFTRKTEMLSVCNDRLWFKDDERIVVMNVENTEEFIIMEHKIDFVILDIIPNPYCSSECLVNAIRKSVLLKFNENEVSIVELQNINVESVCFMDESVFLCDDSVYNYFNVNNFKNHDIAFEGNYFSPKKGVAIVCVGESHMFDIHKVSYDRINDALTEATVCCTDFLSNYSLSEPLSSYVDQIERKSNHDHDSESDHDHESENEF